MNTDINKFTVRLEYQITLNDYIEANNAHMKTNKFYYYGCLVIGSLGVFFGFALMVLTNFYYYLSYVLLLFGLLFILIPILVPRIAVKGMWKREPGIREPRIVTISDDKFIVKIPTAEAVYDWAHFRYFLETKNLFLIFILKDAFIIIPKRAFANVYMEKEFCSLLINKLSRISSNKNA